MNLDGNVNIVYGLAAVANGSSTDSNTTILDMEGWDGVVFFVAITDCADTGVATLNVQGSAANSDGAMATITGATATGTSGANDDMNATFLKVEVYRPLLRYIQGNVTSATANIAFGETYAIQYRGRKSPFADNATIQDATLVVGS